MRAKRPKKPYKSFPLFPHANGSWCVSIDGERKAFGGWASDARGIEAKKLYDRFMEARRVGVAIDPTIDSTVTLAEIVNRYLSRQLRRTESDELGLRDYKDAMLALKQFTECVGAQSRVSLMGPGRFKAYRDMLVTTLSPSTIKRRLAHVKAMFNCAYQDEWIAAIPRMGRDFVSPRDRAPEKPLMFTAGEVVKMIDDANVMLKPMIRLAVECGFGQTDIALLRWDDIDFTAGAIDTHRNKTGARRRCFISNDCINDVNAWREAQQRRDRLGNIVRINPSLVFSTKQGFAVVREIESENPLKPPRIEDSVAKAFDRLLRHKLKIKVAKDGKGFYTLRRTHRTWSDELRDPHACALIMGHKSQSMAGLYVQDISDERLKAVRDHIISKLRQSQSHPPAPDSGATSGAVLMAQSRQQGKRSGKPASHARSDGQ